MFKVSISVTEMNNDGTPRENAKQTHVQTAYSDTVFYSKLPDDAIRAILSEVIEDFIPVIKENLANAS